MSKPVQLHTHDYFMQVGKYRGHRITRVPRSYLRWMINHAHPAADMAQAELDRRGDTLPQLEVSAHAVDRASQRLLKDWKRLREDDEGLYAWLARMATEAMIHHGKREGRLAFKGVVFQIAPDGVWPTVTSCWRETKRGRV